MDRLGARVKGALLGVAVGPVVSVFAAMSMAAMAIVGTLLGGVPGGAAGAKVGSLLVGGLGGALGGGLAVVLLGTVQGSARGAQRVLAVLALATCAGVGTRFSPFLAPRDAASAALAAFFATAALAGAALLTPHVEEPSAWPRRRPGGP